MVWGRPVAKLGLSLALACAAIMAWAPVVANPEGWSDDLRLTWTDLSSTTDFNNGKKVACDVFGNVHVVWTDQEFEWPDNFIYYICKPAGGADWTQPVCVDSYFGPRLPALACDPWGNVHVVWCSHYDWPDIYYRKYDGTSWGPIQHLTDDGYESWNPAVAADGWGRVHVVWSDLRDGNEEIYYKQFDGTSWGPDVQLTDYGKISRYPAIAVDSQGVVHVVWVGNSGMGWPLCYKKLTQSGWSPDTVVAPHYCNHPAIAIGPDDAIHLAWDGARAGVTYDQVYYKERDGSGWRPEVRLTFTNATSRYPSVAADVYGNVHVAWFDLRDGNDEIYYCIREGTTWGPNERLTNDSGLSQFPSIDTDSRGSVHLVWCDARDTTNYEVYYKQRYAPGAGLPLPDPPVGTPCQVRVSPNPARSEVELGYWLASPSQVSVVIADIAGRVVWRRSCASPSQGWNSATWTCRDMSGQPVAPGIYLARVRAGTSGSVAKIVVIE